jgi:hypothetical protein
VVVGAHRHQEAGGGDPPFYLMCYDDTVTSRVMLMVCWYSPPCYLICYDVTE